SQVYLLLDRLVETRREQIERKLEAMAAAVKKKDAGTIFQHISESFQVGSLNKSAFRSYVEGHMKRGMATELTVWDIKFPDDTGKVTFSAKPRSNFGETPFYLVQAEFTRDRDGEWRLKDFQVFNPAVDTKTPMGIPSLR